MPEAHRGTGALGFCLLQRYPETLRISLWVTPGARHISVSTSPSVVLFDSLGGCLHTIQPIPPKEGCNFIGFTHMVHRLTWGHSPEPFLSLPPGRSPLPLVHALR